MFQIIYVLLWTLVNVVVYVVSKFPALVRPSWTTVIDSQIGETAETIKRTDVIWDLDAIALGDKKAQILKKEN